jgi:hypothetical protein
MAAHRLFSRVQSCFLPPQRRCRIRWSAARFGFGDDVDMIRFADEAARERHHVGQHELLNRIELLLDRERIARHLLCQFGEPACPSRPPNARITARASNTASSTDEGMRPRCTRRSRLTSGGASRKDSSTVSAIGISAPSGRDKASRPRRLRRQRSADRRPGVSAGATWEGRRSNGAGRFDIRGRPSARCRALLCRARSPAGSELFAGAPKAQATPAPNG